MATDLRMQPHDRREVLRRARWTLGVGLVVPLYLAWEGVVSLAMGTGLILLPHDVVSSPTVSALYHWVTPTAWGVVFLLLGVTCFAAVLWPTPLWRHAMLFLFEVQALWAIGLSVPVLSSLWQHWQHHAVHIQVNAVAPWAWTNLFGTTVIILEHARRFPGSR